MLQKVKQRKQEGFTIIEVLIVLAIAGLIMLVVFMAVPALQRNSRNTQRKSDVSALLAAYQETVNNSAGQLPASCTGTTATCWVRNAKMSNYDNTTASVTWNYVGVARGAALAAPTTADAVTIANFLKCNTAGQASIVANATKRSVVALYNVETTGGVQTQCIES